LHFSLDQRPASSQNFVKLLSSSMPMRFFRSQQPRYGDGHFDDPQEGAFSVNVPEGWQVLGGTARQNALQYRNWVTVTSPDRATILALNDPSEWAYVVPSSLLAAAGFREGSVYSGGAGTTYVVARYQDGEQFATAWLRRKLAPICKEVKFVASRARPELTTEINSLGQPDGLRHDAGEASFTCVKDGMPLTAYALVTVGTIKGQAGAIWYSEAIVAFLAPTPVAGPAAGLLAEMIATVKVNPDWAARQTQTNMEVSAAARSNAAISDSIMREWESRGAVRDRVLEEGSRARLGIDVYTNPDTGTKYTVANGHNFYWVNPGGTVVGTDTNTAPKGFSPLNRVPP
jgi:hypothetical protein